MESYDAYFEDQEGVERSNEENNYNLQPEKFCKMFI